MIPICCGRDAEWIVQSISLSYWFCRECRNEVSAKKDDAPEAPLVIDDPVYLSGQPIGLVAPRAHTQPVTPMLHVGDTVVTHYGNGYFTLQRVGRHGTGVKAIPSNASHVEVNGKIVYDTRKAPPAAAKPSCPVGGHLWAVNTDTCIVCGITGVQYKQQQIP